MGSPPCEPLELEWPVSRPFQLISFRERPDTDLVVRRLVVLSGSDLFIANVPGDALPLRPGGEVQGRKMRRLHTRNAATPRTFRQFRIAARTMVRSPGK